MRAMSSSCKFLTEGFILFPHPFSSLHMSRIKPEKLVHQNVLMRKENQEVKRTKDWQ